MDFTWSIVAIPILALIGVVVTACLLAWVAVFKRATVFVERDYER